MNRPVRVLVVDDSALMRKLIPQILEREASIQVVGTAIDGEFALHKIPDLKPDVITLDLEMPRMDGMETLRKIMRQFRLPTIVVSAHSTEGASATFKALSIGAFDFVTKPVDPTANMGEIAEELVAKIKAASKSRLVNVPLPQEKQKRATAPRGYEEPTKVVAIGISTGGPQALQYVLSQLPASFEASILVVQHMPEGFTSMFAKRLDETCALEVKEACSGDLLLPGRVLISPGNKHLKVRRMPQADVAILAEGEKVNGHRPSADVLMFSVAEAFGERAVGVLMTGMGEDGAEGLGAIKQSGGMTLAQSEESCVVFGMPRVAIERGHATKVVALDALAHAIQMQCMNLKQSPAVARATVNFEVRR